jgi:hypothetical protein
MPPEIQNLFVTVITIALLHTISGPDHYLPFIVLSKSGNWSLGKTVGWTLVCGLGHIASSVLLGLGGAALGWSVSRISGLETLRGGLAAWALLGFGVLYLLWALYRQYRNRPHKHFDATQDGNLYVYEHQHDGTVMPQQRFKVTPWVIFIIFVLGPCEPMIPLLFFPAAKNTWWVLPLLIAVYTICTLVTMLAMVLLGYYGLGFSRLKRLERYVHILGAATIILCAVGMLWLGW